MRLTDDEFRAAVRAFFDALPVERLHSLALKFLADPFTNSQAQPGRATIGARGPGRPRKAAEGGVDEGKVVSLHQRKPGRPQKAVAGRDVDEEQAVALHQRNPRRRRRRGRAVAVDAAKLAERRKRAAANRRAARAAAKAAKGSAPGTAGNGEDVAVTPAMLWQHAERIQPTAPWKAVAREFGVKDIHAQAAYRNQSLPPHVGAMAITKFLTLPVSN